MIAPASLLPAAGAERLVALVTGGSRGIGLALAHELAARGHALVLVARGADALEAAAAAIEARHGVAVEAIVRDLSKPDAPAGLLSEIARRGWAVDILVNCAGIGSAGRFVDNPAPDQRAVLDLNVAAATSLLRLCLPGMLGRRRGSILNVASLAGTLPMPYVAVYGASKAYLLALSRAVAGEAAGCGVGVSVLLPGPVDTTFLAGDTATGGERTRLLPGLSAETVARVAVAGLAAGERVITPGMLGSLCRLGIAVLPKRMPMAVVRSTLGRAAGGTKPLAPPGPSAIGSARPQRALWSTLRRHGHRLLLALIALAFVLQAAFAMRKGTVDPDPGSEASVAAGLVQHGVFARTFRPGSADPPAPGRFLAPAYPAFVAAVAMLDPRLAAAINCPATERAACAPRRAFMTLFALQALAGLAALLLAYLLARALSGSVGTAALVTFLLFIMGRYPDFAGVVSNYAMVPPLALGCCLALVLAHQRQSLPLVALAGGLVGVLTLVEIYYSAFLLLVPPLLLAAERTRNSPSWSFAVRAAALLVVPALVVMAPWMARNLVQFGDIALTAGIETENLARRVTYNAATPRDALVGLFYWLPAVGDLSNLFLPRAQTVKFDVFVEGSLLANTQAVIKDAGGDHGPAMFARLLRTYLVDDPAGYALSSLLMIERGLRSTSGLFVLWGWLTLPTLLRRLSAEGRLGPFLLVAGPLIGLALVQALVTPNLPWMNLALLLVYAYAVVAVTGGLELPLLVRRRLGSSPVPIGPSAARGATGFTGRA